jgi:HSP20 family protein
MTIMNELLPIDPFAVNSFEDTLRGMMRPWRMDQLERVPQIRIDLTESDTSYSIKADIPGVRKEDLDVRIEGNQVTIGAEVKKEREEKKNGRVLRSERQYGYASRSFSLPSSVDDAKSEAKYENGVLELTIPKKGSGNGRKLSVH